MNAGEELDALVHKHVMGRPVFAPPAYSSDIKAAWEVVEKSNAVVEMFNNPRTKKWAVRFEGQDDWTTATSAPLAICLAALKAVGVEVPS